jgi:hypothetical protein
MHPKQTLSLHGKLWEGFRRLNISHQATAAAVATFLTFSPIALLTWALVTYAQGTGKSDNICEGRHLGQGFIGNSDFYGLGIRLGIYLQWLASLIANPLLKSERSNMAGAYLTFSLALAVAMLLLAFQHSCVFTAEVIIVLNIFWGGTLLVMVPFVHLLADIRTTGLGLALIPLILFMLPVSAWFWLRLALRGEEDFVATPPDGTSFFLVAPVGPSQLKAVSFFIAVLTLMLCVIPVFSGLCLCLVLFLKWVGEKRSQWRVAEEEKGTREKIRDRLERLRRRWTRAQPKKSSSHW